VLANAYAQKKDFANAYTYQALYFEYRDSILNTEVKNKSNLLQYNYDLEKKQAQIEALNHQRKLQRFFLAGALTVLGFIIILAIVLYRNNRQKHKANIQLQNQKEVIEEQRNEADKTLKQLQRTQAHLIQSEKMASLGELTAGIAHEIQNPLNFVNNFSELNKELLNEMKDEIEKGNVNGVKSIAGAVISNEEKINHHGKRADAIVKSMLQHSRSAVSVKEQTDINRLTDEYLQLAYHNWHAKDKSLPGGVAEFTASLKTDYDESIEKINVVPQDIGRVLLNIINNAFYSVSEKKNALTLRQAQNEPGSAEQLFEPTVSISTKKLSDKVEIKVSDNGNGIPQNIVDKIFQPFFTTRPTGQGIGLGLSLSYDIVKAHGGELKVNASGSGGAEFIIQLPAGA
jgi:signal transduction histidine kinase